MTRPSPSNSYREVPVKRAYGCHGRARTRMPNCSGQPSSSNIRGSSSSRRTATLAAALVPACDDAPVRVGRRKHSVGERVQRARARVGARVSGSVDANAASLIVVVVVFVVLVVGCERRAQRDTYSVSTCASESSSIVIACNLRKQPPHQQLRRLSLSCHYNTQHAQLLSPVAAPSAHVRNRFAPHGIAQRYVRVTRAVARVYISPQRAVPAPAANTANNEEDARKSRAGEGGGVEDGGGSALVRFTRPHTMRGTVLGASAGVLRALSGLEGPIPVALIPRALLGLLALLLGNGFIVGVNQVYDVAIDRVNKPFLPVASGELSKRVAWLLVITCAVGGLFLVRTLFSPLI
eukprot:IDg11080t1